MGNRKRRFRCRDLLLLAVPAVLLLAAVTGFALYAHANRALAAERAQSAALQAQVEALRAETAAPQTAAAQTSPETETAAATTAETTTAAATTTATTTAETTTAETAAPLSVESLAAGTVADPDSLAATDLSACFVSSKIAVGDAVYERIYGKSYVDNPNVALSDLRYLKVLHYNFDHEVQVGELIVNAALADDFLQIFRELYDSEYEIKSMHLIDDYWTGEGESSDTASIQQNNTSCFCYRAATGSSKLSKHAYGRAIDINPQQNPYVSYASGSASWYHSNASDYVDRTSGNPHVITHSNTCYVIFAAHGFSWGGDWSVTKDYQHFEKS